MQRKQMMVLVVTTAVAVLAAALVTFQKTPEEEVARRTLLSDLAGKIDTIAAIKISDHDRSLDIRKAKDGRWVLPEKTNYPANAGLVRKVVLGLATLKVVEEKTSDPDLYARLGVEDVAAKGAKSHLVELQDDAGKTVAALLIGNRATGDRTYVRIMDAAQSYLVSGAPEIETGVKGWLDDTLLTVEKERVKRVTVRPVAGGAVAISSAKPDGPFTVENLPKGRTAKSYGGADVAASSLNYLIFDDVRPATPSPKPTIVTVTTFDGLTVTAGVAGAWVHFAAAFDPSAAEQGKGVVVMPKAPADGAREAADINTRLRGWDYKLPDYKIKDLAPTLEDLLEPKAEKGKK